MPRSATGSSVSQSICRTPCSCVAPADPVKKHSARRSTRVGMSTPVSAIRRSRYGGTLVRPAVGLTPAPRLQSPQESLRLWYAQRPEVRLSSRARNLIEPAKHIFNWQRPRIRYHYSPRGPQTVVGPRIRGGMDTEALFGRRWPAMMLAALLVFAPLGRQTCAATTAEPAS